MGIMIAPTTGINQAGLIISIFKSLVIQKARVLKRKIKCKIVPVIHNPKEKF
jgi:hypothetical protein